jgi:hypothetical protein
MKSILEEVSLELELLVERSRNHLLRLRRRLGQLSPKLGLKMRETLPSKRREKE